MYKLLNILDDDTRKIAADDPKQIIENFFRIVDKSGRVVPFMLNEAQAMYYDKMTARDDILKARKEGFSSLILAIFTVKFLFLENVNCVCISHEADSTARLFDKVEFYVNNLFSKNGEKIEVNLTDKSRKRMVLKYNKKSKDGNEYTVTNTFYVGTAGAKAFGRGDTIHYLHGSEIAFWDDASRILTGLLNAVPDDLTNTQVVKESTANGSGTQHHTEWKNEKMGASVFTPHFFGWFLDPTNKMPTPKGFTRTPEEDAIAAKVFVNDGVKLTNQQLYWRRWKISSMQPDGTRTKEELFKQEYPVSDVEAFLSTGKSIFDEKVMSWYEEAHVRPPDVTGELVGWDPPFLLEGETGRLSIWYTNGEAVLKDRTYVIGADTSEGGDYSYAVVLDRNTLTQVAEFQERMDPYEFANVLYRMGKYWNDALIGCERNNQGIAVVTKLDELGYDNQYRRETLDEITKKIHNELGWRTDSVTRPIMLSDYNQVVTERKYIFHSRILLEQQRSFVRNKKGRPEAAFGANDDAVISNAIAYQMYKHVPEPIAEGEIMVRNYSPGHSLSNFLNRNK